MRMALRFIVPLLLVLGGIAWAATPVLGELIERWFRADVEQRSQLVFDSINDTVARLVKDAAGPRLSILFQGITRDERLLAVGLCTPDGHLSHRSTTWPKTLGCPPRAGGTPTFTVTPRSDGAVLTAVFALRDGEVDLGDLIIVHDLSFIERRGAKLERYLAVFIAAYTLRRVWLSDAEQDGYYYGLANEGLWPLCHIVFVRPTFRASDWDQYVAVNRKFADAVVAEAQSPNPLVLVQDYHFALLPQMVRERLPGATIITFWHLPWPNPEVFGICPWREEILQGLLGSTILGFHTQFHCLNFLDSVDRFLECHIDREQSTARTCGQTTLVRPYPISIEWPPAALVGQPSVAECRVQVRRDYGLGPDVQLAVGVERFDYTKGIADRFRAVENLLDNHPEWIGRLTLLQIAAPTRSRLPSYRQTQAEAEAVANAVNERFGRADWRPIVLVARHHEPEQVFTLFRAADLCLVSSLHDGMNLVAKEFVAARDDDGVLVLSSFAGVSRELLEALIINPYDSGAMAGAMHRALLMPREQRRERMHLMRALVSEHNIYFWAGRMLLEAARLRKRQRIEDQIVRVSTPVRRPRRRDGR